MTNEKESLIGESMSIVGEVACKGRMVLEGRLEGSFIGKNLIIRETGEFLGQGTGESIECSGRMEGHVRTMSFRLNKTGYYVGKVETRDLTVEPGAVLDSALQSGSLKWREFVQDGDKGRSETPLDLGNLLKVFSEEHRACCMDVPWSERLELYSHLLRLLEQGKPLIKITGSSGSGKSTLVKKLCDGLPDDTFEILQIKDKVGSVTALLKEVASSLGVAAELMPDSPRDCMARLKSVLDKKLRGGRRIVVIIDDAQEMYPATLEGVTRLLTDGYGEGEDLVQVVLLGTSEIESRLVPTISEYFADETNCQLGLDPLNIKDTADYFRFALQQACGDAGVASVSLFPYETIQAIHQRSQGNIGAINRLADTALRKAYTAGVSSITPEMLF